MHSNAFQSFWHSVGMRKREIVRVVKSDAIPSECRTPSSVLAGCGGPLR